MRFEPLGDSAWILRDLSAPAYRVAEAIRSRNFPGVIEAVASYETVGIYCEPEQFDVSWLGQLDLEHEPVELRSHTIPVCYEMGEDLEFVAQTLNHSTQTIIDLHGSKLYQCFAVGFCPGFPYLGYLPDALCGIQRRSSPRVRVPPGSVALTGRQTGIYPLERPGGWAIVGRTPLCLVDVESAYFPIKAGDEIRFVPISVGEFEALLGSRL